jgi:hypothetical protein
VFDSILNQSIQRWEYEGGRILRAKLSNDDSCGDADRNRINPQWNRANRTDRENFVERPASSSQPGDKRSNQMVRGQLMRSVEDLDATKPL